MKYWIDCLFSGLQNKRDSCFIIFKLNLISFGKYKWDINLKWNWYVLFKFDMQSVSIALSNIIKLYGFGKLPEAPPPYRTTI